jgi:hypothetical protein
MRLCKVGLAVVLVVVCVSAAIDSLAIANGIQNAGNVATVVASATNNSQYIGLIQTVVSVGLAVVAFFFGHKHGVNSTK